jgi:hypothetical protein
MTRHALAAEYGTETPGGCAMLAWCWCGFQFTATARTVRRARRVLWAKSAYHRGQAMAGPGGTE